MCKYMYVYIYMDPTCWIRIPVFLRRSHKNTNNVFRLLNPVIWHGYVQIQGQRIHKTGWIWIESRTIFLALRIQHVGAGHLLTDLIDLRHKLILEARTNLLAFTRYGHYQYCIGYGMRRGPRWGEAYIAQCSCTNVAIGAGFAAGGGNKRSTIKLWSETISGKG